MYYKNVAPDEVAIVSPMQLGGLKSKEYLAKNPMGLMPMLVLSENEEPIPESDTIARFLCSAFSSRGPELEPSSPIAAARVNKVCRLHDLYIAPIQGCLYKASGANMFPPFGRFATRRAAIDDIVKQMRALEAMVAPYGGPYLCGSAPTAADCAVFPTYCFLLKMLPKFGVDTQDAFGPTVTRWWAHMSATDPVGVRVYGEIMGALDGWDENGRWDSIAGAGLRDLAPPTLFDKILTKQIPADVVYEDEHVRMPARRAISHGQARVQRQRRSPSAQRGGASCPASAPAGEGQTAAHPFAPPRCSPSVTSRRSPPHTCCSSRSCARASPSCSTPPPNTSSHSATCWRWACLASLKRRGSRLTGQPGVRGAAVPGRVPTANHDTDPGLSIAGW